MTQPGRNSDVEKVRREKLRREKIRDGESQKREDAAARKGRKVAKHCVFAMFRGSGGPKRLAKAAGAEPAGKMRMKNCMPLWREAHVEVNNGKNWRVRGAFGS